ncbi:MAG: WD40 repeat domain-containing protein [bacterium]|nr:WD40 repeat domain-containing protein [bacterium]
MRKIMALLTVPAAAFIMACGSGDMVRYPNEDGIPNNCESPTPDPAYYRPEIFPRFDLNSNTLSLVNWSTGETEAVLATYDSIAHMQVLDWSPNCRYFMTLQGGDGVIWDTVSGQELVRYSDVPNFTNFSTSITWDPNSRYITVESGGDTYLLDLQTRANHRLTDHYFIRQYWDVARGLLFTISEREVAAYDLNTGAKVVTYAGLDGSWRFVQSQDGSKVAFYQDNMRFRDDAFTLHVFNRDGSGHVEFYIGDYVLPGRIAFSPDNRYVALGGYMLSVWDLQNPPTQTTEREPLYEYAGPGAYIETVRWAESGVIETTSSEGTMRWNLTDGGRVTAQAN